VSTATGMGNPAPSGSDANRLILAAYRQMLLFLFLGALTVIAILLLFIFVPYMASHAGQVANNPSAPAGNGPSIPILPIVVLAGTIGSFFSSLQRLYNFSEMPQILYDKHFDKKSSFLFIYSLVPALVGGISAVVLYLIFAAGLLSSGFFPAFKCKIDACTNLAAVYDWYGPTDASDYAKAILWGFIAGFAERLVPDLLSNFVQAAEKNSGTPAGPANGEAANFSRDPATWPDATAAAEAAAAYQDDVRVSPVASRAMANQTSSLPLTNERG
jgi:hypothetical protein